MNALAGVDRMCESMRRDIEMLGRTCEAACHRAALFEEMGHPRTAAISRERAMNDAHTAEVYARCLARWTATPPQLHITEKNP